ncbi:MAG: hypothetical protein KGZ74_07280 [Chitinophagaceae bacterium]|nr:hypothetical protein [Chitinophagaceae bacterium]
MFDLTTLGLQDSIARDGQRRMLEAQKQKQENRKLRLSTMLEGFSDEYKSIANSKITKQFERQTIVESVAINSVKNIMYDIFNNALMLDESAKGYYSDTLKSIFNVEFQKILTENNITNLKQFRDFIKKSHKLLETTMNKSLEFAKSNEFVYTSLLETYYNSSSTHNLIMEAYDVLTGDEFIQEKYIEVLNTLSDNIREELISQLKSANIGEQINQLIMLLNKGLVSDTKTVLFNRRDIISKIMVIINIYTKSVEEEINKADINKQVLIDYKATFSNMVDMLRTTAMFYEDKTELENNVNVNSIKNAIDKVLDIYRKVLKLVEANRNMVSGKLNESFIGILSEAEHAIANNDEDKLGNLFTIIRSRIKDTLNTFDPYKGLEELKFANKIIKEHNQYQSFLTFGVSGGTWVYLIIKALKSKNLPESIESQYVKEAEKFKTNLEKLISTAGSDNHKDVKNLQRQLKTLSEFLDKYKMNKNDAKKKLVRDYGIPTTDIMENAIEMAQYIQLYEVNAADLKYMISNLEETASNIETIDEKKLLLDTLQKEAVSLNIANRDESQLALGRNYYKLESVLYDQINSVKPINISEAANEQLRAGKYPYADDFLDNDEKEMVNTIANLSGKENAISIIKDKVISVIESEEKRTKEREEEEQIMLNKLSQEKVDDINKSMTESSRIYLNSGRLNMPETLFEAIIMNRSKKYIKEATQNGTGIDILSKKDIILSESVVLYTIHETFNTLNFVKGDFEGIHKLMNDYYYEKI